MLRLMLYYVHEGLQEIAERAAGGLVQQRATQGKGCDRLHAAEDSCAMLRNHASSSVVSDSLAADPPSPTPPCR
jgi:hypothetical protein